MFLYTRASGNIVKKNKVREASVAAHAIVITLWIDRKTELVKTEKNVHQRKERVR